MKTKWLLRFAPLAAPAHNGLHRIPVVTHVLEREIAHIPEGCNLAAQTI